VEAMPHPDWFAAWARALVHTEQEAGWPSEPVWTGLEKKKFLGLESWTVEPALSHYTDCAIPAKIKHYGLYNT